MKKGTNVHIYYSSFKFDSRISKEVKFIEENKLFEKIVLIGFKEKNMPKFEIKDNIHFLRLNCYFSNINSFLGKIIKHIEWQAKVILSLIHLKDIKVINAHSLSVLPTCVLYKKFFVHTKLIYDTHELETETIICKGARKYFFKFIEKNLIQYVDHMIVVNNSIRDWYHISYNMKNIHVVRNIPKFNEDLGRAIELKKLLTIPNEEILFLYQGSLSEGRGIELILELFCVLGYGYHILFIGNGKYQNLIIDKSKSSKNIHHMNAVSFYELFAYTKAADIGIHLIEKSCLNHMYCLPNKIFEYLLSDLPIFVRDIPELSCIVEKYKCGWIVSDDFEEIKKRIQSITYAEVRIKKKNAMECKRVFSWDKESEILRKIYSSLLA